MLRSPIVYTLSLLACANWIAANAAAIHKWVDDKGVTHYSDEAPSSPVSHITRLEISTGNLSATVHSAPSDEYYSIANQWQRLQKERLQQQKIELQRAAIIVNRSVEPKRTQESDDSHSYRYLVAYPARKHRRHGYPKHHKRPRQNPVRSTGFRPVN